MRNMRQGDCGSSPLDEAEFEGFRELVNTGCSLRTIGIALAWIMVHSEARLKDGEKMTPLMMVIGGTGF